MGNAFSGSLGIFWKLLPFLWLSEVRIHSSWAFPDQRDRALALALQFSTVWLTSARMHGVLQTRGVNLSCIRTCVVVAEERPRIALQQSFSKLFKDIGLSPRAVSTTFGSRVNVAICLQVTFMKSCLEKNAGGMCVLWSRGSKAVCLVCAPVPLACPGTVGFLLSLHCASCRSSVRRRVLLHSVVL